MWPRLWFSGQGAWEARQGPPTSKKAWGKVPAVEPPPPEADEKLTRQLQEEEEDAAEWMQRGQNAATLVVMREAAGPTNVGPSGGLGWALIGGWAKPAAHSCGSPATGGSGNLATNGGGILATPPTLTTGPCPAFSLNACGWPFAGLGHCCGLAAHGCPSSHLEPCWVMPDGEPAKQPEAPEPQ